MDFLHKLLGRVGNTVNNDIVKPIQRDAVRPVNGALQQLLGNRSAPTPGFNVAPMQKVNLVEGGRPNFGAPTIPAYQGNQIRLDAQQRYNLTPGFVQNLINANPYVGKPLPTSGLTNQNAANAEYLGQKPINQIVLSPTSSRGKLTPKLAAKQAADTLVHEGLHRVWDTNPDAQKQFTDAYNAGAPRTYLQSRVAGYTAAQPLMDGGGVYTNNFSKLQTLPPTIQNEIHSYIPEYYSSVVGYPRSTRATNTLQKFGILPAAGQSTAMPSNLKNYYKQYGNF